MSCTRAFRVLALALLAVALSACASDPKFPGNRETYQATVRVNNENSQLSNFTVHLVAATGQRRRLGNVNLNEVTEFGVNRPSSAGEYQLMAELITGSNVFSPRFTLREGDQVTWELRRNRVFFDGNFREGR